MEVFGIRGAEIPVRFKKYYSDRNSNDSMRSQRLRD